MEEKITKKKSVFAKIMIILFSIIMVFVLAVVGISIFVKVKYDVNVISLTSQLSKMSKGVDDSYLSSSFSDSDKVSAESKSSSISETPLTRFSGKEIGALVSAALAENNNLSNIFETSLTALEFNDFNDETVYKVNISAILKIDLAKFKAEKMSTFPASMFKGAFPDIVYAKVSFSANWEEYQSEYEITDANVCINNLDAEDTAQIFRTINMFVGSGSSQNFANEVSTNLMQALFGDSGVYNNFVGKTGFAFEDKDNSVYLDVYSVSLTETRTISYVDELGAANSNKTTFKITDNTIYLSNLSANGYNFDGWFIGDEKITQIDAKEFHNYILTAKWSTVQYSIIINLNGGEFDDETPVEYTYNIKSPKIEITKTPSKTIDEIVCPFDGWISEESETLLDKIVVETGSYGNKLFTAKYIGDTKTVSIYIDGEKKDEFQVELASKLNEETVFDASKIGMGGFFVDTWYTNPAMTTEYNFGSKVLDNVYLYGKLTYITNSVYFADYITAFENAQITRNLTITSREMLLGYVDYVVFYQITTEVQLKLSYISTSGMNGTSAMNAYKTEVETVTSNYKNIDRIPVSYALSMNYSALGSDAKAVIISTLSNLDSQATLTMDTTKSSIYAQQDYALHTTIVSTRTAETTFNVDKIKNTITVSTSEQLVWALENGYKPVCVENSAAERVYNKAKTVLRNICTDAMSDFEKTRAIYEWIILNTAYDNLAYSKVRNNQITDEETRLYKCWFAEGVFDDGVAVCEGFAKAFVILARIEGIPALYVTNDMEETPSDSGAHAWNKVYIDGKWYVLDSTHGNAEDSTSNIETLSYSEFLITDAEKTARGYTLSKYTDSKFAATTSYNYYEEYSTLDLAITSENELRTLFNEIKNYSSSTRYFTIDVYVPKLYHTSFNGWVITAKNACGLTLLYSGQLYSKDSLGNYYYTVVFVK